MTLKDTYVAPPSTAESDPHISVVSSVFETFVKDSEGVKTSGITVGSVSEDGSRPVNDFQTKIGRSERLGVPVQFPEQEKRNSRAERFGHVLPSTAADEEAKEKARLARFAPHSKTDSGRRNKKNKGNQALRDALLIYLTKPKLTTMGIFIMKGNNLSSEAIEQALVGNLSRPVIDLEFNAIASNLLASGADGGKICIWNLAAPVVSAIVNNDLMSLFNTGPLKFWKETLALICTFAQIEEWTVLCDMLALKLMAAGNTLAATLCCVFDLRVKATFMRTKVVCTRCLLTISIFLAEKETKPAVYKNFHLASGSVFEPS
ncbi:putative nucleotide binding protein [Corchorus capsularis]|uniref:Putative nucleotide binding protein n=1 Tax=Corchorus capsularis TaxID=210143 RepID=A0A1R3GCT7_COCAP|nr:putative nucleotide binding protein [Corchorus capsularis]